jgi:hypothetical protein
MILLERRQQLRGDEIHTGPSLFKVVTDDTHAMDS